MDSLMRFDKIAEINPTISIPVEANVPFVEMSALPRLARDIAEIGERDFKGSGSRFSNGDTLMARITPCLENGKGACVSTLPDGRLGFGSMEFIVARACLKDDERFIYYLTRSEAFREVAISRMIARITPCLQIGKTAFVDSLPEYSIRWGSTEFFVMRGQNEASSAFIYCLSRLEEFRDHAIQSMVGSSGRQRVQQDRLNDSPNEVPPIEILEAFANLPDSVFRALSANGDQTETLATLRDSLFTKLMSGEFASGTPSAPWPSWPEGLRLGGAARGVGPGRPLGRRLLLSRSFGGVARGAGSAATKLPGCDTHEALLRPVARLNPELPKGAVR